MNDTTLATTAAPRSLGAATAALHMHEISPAYDMRHATPEQRQEHNELLLAVVREKEALRVWQAEQAGRYELHPKPERKR